VPILSHSIFPARLRKFFRFGVPEKWKVTANKNKTVLYMDGENEELVAKNIVNCTRKVKEANV